jgi:hypothetical protein
MAAELDYRATLVELVGAVTVFAAPIVVPERRILADGA